MKAYFKPHQTFQKSSLAEYRPSWYWVLLHFIEWAKLLAWGFELETNPIPALHCVSHWNIQAERVPSVLALSRHWEDLLRATISTFDTIRTQTLKGDCTWPIFKGRWIKMSSLNLLPDTITCKRILLQKSCKRKKSCSDLKGSKKIFPAETALSWFLTKVLLRVSSVGQKFFSHSELFKPVSLQAAHPGINF